MNYCFSKILNLMLCAVMLMCGCVGECASKNSLGISDELYPLYVSAYKRINSKEGLALADSLRREAAACGDKTAELYAMSVKLKHYFGKGVDVETYKKEAKPMMDKALEYNMVNFYYTAVTNISTCYQRDSKFIEAYNYLKAQMEFARTHGHKLGVSSIHRSVGLLHYHRYEMPMAIDCFRQAIDYTVKNKIGMELTLNYISMGECYCEMCEYDSVLAVVKEGLPTCVNNDRKCALLQQKCFAQFMMGDYDGFRDSYKTLMESRSELNTTSAIKNNIVKVLKNIDDGNDEAALKYIAMVESQNASVAYRLYAELYKCRHEYIKSLEYTKKYLVSRNEKIKDVAEADAQSMENIYRNKDLDAEHQRALLESARLQLANTQLALKNSSLELDRLKDEASLATLAAESNKLRSDNQRLQSRKLAEKLEQQNLKRDARERHMHLQNIIMAIAVAVVMVVIVMIAAFTVRSRRMSEKLRKSNENLQNGIVELEKMREQAQEAEKMKTMFVQNMSHEIRTPLNAIVGFTQVLLEMEEDLDVEEKRNMTKMIADNSELLTALVNDIFELTNLSSGTYAMKMDEVNVNEMCREAVETVRHRKAEGVELRVDSKLPADYRVTTDPRRVIQVLINMLTNAEKNTTEGSIVLSCSLDEHPGMITFVVTDTGVGVPKDKMEEIFKRFRKLNNHKQGTGLGLDICRTIAGKLGGEINIDPNYTGGARFWFTIPAQQ